MNETVKNIIRAFQPFHDGETACDDNWFHRSISTYVTEQKPIPFIFLGFPGKSINPNSVSGYLPDLGEEIAFDNLRSLIQAIENIYTPGIKLNILSEGHCFMRTGCIRPAHELDAYIEETKKIKNSDRIKISTIHDFYKNGDIGTKIDLFEKQYLPDIAEVYTAIMNDPYYRQVYTDRIAFIYHEFTPVLYPGLTKSRRHAMAKVIARSFIGHQMAVNKLVADYFPDHIRLSIHQQHDPSAQRYYINLLPNVSGIGTPWFHTINLHDDQTFVTKRIA
jgi:pyoverdine/dityrosine biosynthesis protein Dit1